MSWPEALVDLALIAAFLSGFVILYGWMFCEGRKRERL